MCFRCYWHKRYLEQKKPIFSCKHLDENDEKQWLVSRTDLLHKSFLTELENIEGSLSEISKTEVTRIKGRRNNILSGLGIALSVFLGIHAIESLEDFWFFSILAGIIGIGLFVFIFFNVVMMTTNNLFTHITNACLDCQGTINFSYGYFISRTSSITNLDYNFLRNYFTFIGVVGLSCYIPIISSLKEGNSIKVFLNPEIRDTLNADAELLAKNVINFEKAYKALDTNQNLPKEILEFVEKSLADLKKLKI